MYGSLNRSEVNHIKTSLSRCSAQDLADELGRTRRTIERKLVEIRENERIANIGRYAMRKKAEKKRSLERIKHRIKRSVKGGM